MLMIATHGLEIGESYCENTTKSNKHTSGPWAPCTRTCGEGVQVRQVRCEQELSPNLRITAPEAVCSQRSSRSHIVTSRKCDLGPCSAQELVGIQVKTYQLLN